jgi:hypothetical protein
MFSAFRPDHRVKDDCWFCSKPVYEGDASVRYSGLWVHEACFRDENQESPFIAAKPERPDEDDDDDSW